MNVGIFTNAYRPIVSGVVNAIDLIRDGLTGLGHKVYIIAPGYPGHQKSSEQIFRFPSVNVTSRADFPLPIPFAPRLIALIEQIPLDVVHAQHPFLLGVLGRRIARRKRIPLVFTFHTQYEQYVHYAPPLLPRQLLRLFVREMVSAFVRKCDAVVLPSPSIRDIVGEYGAGEKSHVIPNAISLTSFEAADGTKVRKQLGLQEKTTAIFVGRLAREKNLSFLLRAFARVVSDLPEARLVLVGDGPHRAPLEEEATRLGLQGKVTFTGMVPYAEVPEYMAAASLFVMSSTSEVKPLAILEAMAAGLPVLAIRAPGPADTITHGQDGWLTGESLEEFSRALLDLFENKEKLARLGRGARNKARNFGVDEMARRLENLYNELRAKGAG